jgi:hypothetical protein
MNLYSEFSVVKPIDSLSTEPVITAPSGRGGDGKVLKTTGKLNSDLSVVHPGASLSIDCAIAAPYGQGGQVKLLKPT